MSVVIIICRVLFMVKEAFVGNAINISIAIIIDIGKMLMRISQTFAISFMTGIGRGATIGVSTLKAKGADFVGVGFCVKSVVIVAPGGDDVNLTVILEVNLRIKRLGGGGEGRGS